VVRPAVSFLEELQKRDSKGRAKLSMNIDSHQHFWRYNSARHAWIQDSMSVLKRDFLPADLALEFDSNAIDASVAVQADQSEQETLFLLDLAKGNKRIAGVVGWVDLLSPKLDERLTYFSQFAKLRGLRHVAQDEPDNHFLMRPDFTRAISRLPDFGLTYDILIYPRHLPAATELVAKFPGQRFVVDHLAKPEIKIRRIAYWASRMRIIAANPNVYCKLSGLVTETDWQQWTAKEFEAYLDVVFEAFGVDRLMFGSDWPVCLLAAGYQQVKHIVEDYVNREVPSAKEKIFGGNAIRFYGLKV
jgi:L-fuconolactonase